MLIRNYFRWIVFHGKNTICFHIKVIDGSIKQTTHYSRTKENTAKSVEYRHVSTNEHGVQKNSFSIVSGRWNGAIVLG